MMKPLLLKHFRISEKLHFLSFLFFAFSAYSLIKNVVPPILEIVLFATSYSVFIIMLVDADAYIEKRGLCLHMNKKKLILLCVLNMLMLSTFVVSVYYLCRGIDLTGDYFAFLLSLSCLFLISMFIINKIILCLK